MPYCMPMAAACFAASCYAIRYTTTGRIKYLKELGKLGIVREFAKLCSGGRVCLLSLSIIVQSGLYRTSVSNGPYMRKGTLLGL